MTVAPTLTTERLVLRPYRADHFEAYATMWADPVVVRYIGGTPSSREDSWTRFLRNIGMWQMFGFGFFRVEEAGTGAFLGEVGFQERLREILPSMEGTIETGWALRPEAHGRGIATEAVTTALAWADAAHKGKRYTAIIDAANAASQRVADKAGFWLLADTTYHGVAARLLER